MYNGKRSENFFIHPGQVNNQRNDINIIGPPKEKSDNVEDNFKEISYYPITHAQKRIYYTEKIHPGANCNTVVFTVRYDRVLNPQILEEAFNRIIRENEGLRLQLSQARENSKITEMETAGVVQYVAPYCHYPLDVSDFSAHSDKKELQRWIESKTREPFPLYDHRLYYFAYVAFNSRETGYYLKLHHIICDGWTINRLIIEINRLYRQIEKGESPAISHPPSYLEYIADERNYLQSTDAARDRTFWHDYLHPFPTGPGSWLNSSPKVPPKSGSQRFTFPSDLKERMAHYCTQRRTTVFKLLLSSFAVYMSRRDRCDDVVIGSANHNRTTNRQKEMMGMFVSSIPLRFLLKDHLTFDQFVAENSSKLNEIIKNYQKYPFDVLAMELGETNDVDARRLLDVTMVGQPDIPDREYRTKYIFPGDDANPLTIHVYYGSTNSPGYLELLWSYREEIFTAEDINRMHNSLTAILENALKRPRQKLAEIEWLPKEEKNQILHHFNSNAEKPIYTADKTLQGFFEEQVQRTPDAAALVLSNGLPQKGSGRITYKELNRVSQVLARTLRSKGVGPNTIVGIILERSVEMIAGILGILKAGGAYMPIIPGTPPFRIIYMLKDSGCRILLSNTGDTPGKWNIFELRPPITDENRNKLENNRNKSSSPGATDASNLAYLIYTSGSTGKPKGVLINHGNVSPLLHWGHRNLDIGPGDKTLQNISYNFDWSVWEIFITLSTGVTLHIVPESVSLDPKAQTDYIRRNDITVLHITPSQYRSVMDSGCRLESLRYLLLGAEILTQEIVTRSYESVISPGKCLIFNMYGPTEATIISNTQTIYSGSNQNRFSRSGIPIGKPSANLRMTVVDRYFKMCPIGIPGELIITGDGLARGYLNNPELTAERFIRHRSFVDRHSTATHHNSPGDTNDTFYRTGDLVRWLPDGAVEFLGRLDHQVKIRGYRIELGEIENRITGIHGIKNALVTVKNEDRLCAYFVPDPDCRPEIQGIRQHLEKELPDYMIPAYFVQLDQIPLNANGKPDRARLPEPSESVATTEYIKPETDTEIRLAGVWEKILAVKQIGLEDHFFRQGGHSLSAVKLNAAVHREFNVELTVPEIFAMPTLKQQARHIESASKSTYTPVLPVEDKEYYPLSPAQKQMVVINRIGGDSINYNIPVMMAVQGRLDPAKTTEVFKKLIRRHESLRTDFPRVNETPVQRIHIETDIHFSLHYTLRQHRSVKQMAGEFTRPFDLEKAPLFRVYLVDNDNGEQLLFIDMHHIISDKISLEVILNEFTAIYDGEKPEMPGLQYRDYTRWFQQQRPVLERQERFWLGQYKNTPPVLELPLDAQRPKIKSFDGATEVFEIEPEKKDALQQLALQQGTTLFMVLQAIFTVLLAKLSGQEDIVLGTPVAGRRHQDLQKLVGMFINTLALRNYPASKKSFLCFLQEVRTNTLGAFENQDYPFEELVKKIQVQRNPARNPLFDVSFALNKYEFNNYNTNDNNGDSQKAPALTMKPFSDVLEISKFDMSLTAELLPGNNNQELILTIDYCKQLFRAETIKRFASYYKKIIDEVLTNPGQTIAAIEPINEEEKKTLLIDFNRRNRNEANPVTLPRLFEAQVERTPNNPAVIGLEGEIMTYRRLDSEAHRLASVLRSEGIGTGSVVGIKMERSLELILGILTILKTGAAYLPINPKDPPQRTRYIMEDSTASLLLTREELLRLRQTAVSAPATASTGSQHPGQFCYIIYTSGSTGTPKGVPITHANLSQLLHWGYRELGIGPSDRAIQNLAYYFDWSVWEIFITLTTGASLYMTSEETLLNPKEKAAFILKHAVTVLHLTPTQHYHLLEAGADLNTLKYLFIGAEKLTLDLVKRSIKSLEKNPVCRIFNMYGPTEATIISAVLEIDPANISRYDSLSSIPIGSPTGSTQLLILDANMNLCPIGVSGELLIAGGGISQGYLNNPELTAEKYIETSVIPALSALCSDTSMTSVPSAAKLYKTGDRARWLANGTVEFLGRIDFQVKIRGYRIELGEIENKLTGFEGIREAIVINSHKKQDPPDKNVSNEEQYLCAYYASDEPLATADIRRYLENRLPTYMIPTYFVRLKTLPLNANGKVDRNALPEPKGDIVTSSNYVPPVDELEKELSVIWQDVLAIEKIGIEDNLFDLGGNSSLLLKAQDKIDARYPGKVKVVDMFTHTSIAKLASFIRGQQEAVGTTAPPPAEKPKQSLSTGTSTNDIAIIGAAVRIKDTDNPEEFWNYLENGIDCIGEIPERRRKDFESLNGTETTTRSPRYQESAYLDDIDTFDYRFFKLSPREASLMDPGQRLFLQTAWKALEDSGYGGRRLYGSDTGVYIGYTNQELCYRQWVAEHAPEDRMLALAGNIQSIIASRISYLMDFKGPAAVLDTACSSGLAALHTACRALRAGECAQAIAGAVKIKLNPLELDFDMEIMSGDGRTRAFDDHSDGTGSGEGVIAVLLKPLDRARRDGDHIRAVIKGTALNQDGSSIGITAPNADAQAAAIDKAWQDAGIDPLTVSYIEAHGTGTRLGDPIEIEGITKAFRRYTDKKQFCAVGSVKSNIGHLDNAAGMAGLVKAILALEHKKIPPQIHYKTPNRQIDFENSPVYVNDRLQEWQRNGTLRRCGVSSFGMSGTNCHVVLEEAPNITETIETVENEQHTPQIHILTLSAGTSHSLKTLVEAYVKFTGSTAYRNLSLGNLCYTANTGRGHYNHRLALTVAHKDDLKQKLHQLADSVENSGFINIKIPGIYYGNFRAVPPTKKNKGKYEYTKADLKQMSEAVRHQISQTGNDGTQEVERTAGTVAGYYTRGADIDWEAYYRGFNSQPTVPEEPPEASLKYRKVPLPTYTFEKKRCWLEPGKKERSYHSQPIPGAPLFDRCQLESENQRIYVTTFSPEGHWLLKEHRVNGIPTMVGTGYLEMAQELWNIYYPGKPVEIRNLTVMTPLTVNEGTTKDVQVVLRMEPDHLEFKVISPPTDHPGGNWNRHASGILAAAPTDAPVRCNITKLKEENGDTKQFKPAADDENESGSIIQVSPRWHCLKTIGNSGQYYLGYLELADRYREDLKNFHLHPPLLDAALHFQMARISTESPYLPMLYKTVRIYGKTPPEVYSRAKLKGTAGGETMNFDIQLMDTAGNIFAVLEDYTLKKVPTAQARLAQKGHYSHVYHETRWIPSPMKSRAHAQPANQTNPGAILAIDGGEETPRGLLKQLIEKSTVPVQFFTGIPNELKIPGQTFNTIDSLRVIYRAAAQSATEHPESEAVQFFSLVKNLLNIDVPSLELILLTRNALEVDGTEEEVNPDNALLIGMVKTIPLEYPHIAVRVIDSDAATSEEILMAEIEQKDGNADDFTVVFRNNLRYVEEFGPVKLDAAADEPDIIRENGVYIITGGLGGIGLEIAGSIASQKNIVPILLDRAPEPTEEQRKRLADTFDGKAVYKCADVSHRQQVQEVLDDVRRSYGAINGVIHCAGVAGDGFIINKKPETLLHVLAPKVAGTRILDRLTRQDRLDFFFLCSSLTALTGAPGQSDYTAANSYQDAYAFYRNKQGHRTLSINWAGWKETGMARNFGVNRDSLFKTLLNKEGVRAFHEALASRRSRVMVGTLDLEQLATGEYHIPARLSPELAEALENINKPAKPSAIPTAASPTLQPESLPEVKLTGREEGIYTPSEIRLASIWAGVLGFDELNIYDNYYDQGGDSINALHIVNKANKILGTDLSVVDIFTHLTLEEFAAHFDQKYKPDNTESTSVDNTAAVPELVPVKAKSYYPVSAAQGRLFILDRFDNTNTGYNLPEIRMLHGTPDIRKLENAVNHLFQRHETLRTYFTQVDDVPVQVVQDAEDVRLKIKVTDISVTNSTASSSVEPLIRDFVRPFDIGRAPLLRVELIKLQDNQYILMMDIHHIIADAMGCEILLQELIRTYGGETLPELTIQYKDYAEWQTRVMDAGILESQGKYWREQFSGPLPVLELPTDYPRPAVQSFAGDTVSFVMNATETQQARTAAKNSSVTLYMMVMAAYYTLLHRYSGQEDIVIGSASAGRPHAELEKLIGMFINIMPIRNHPTPEKTFAQFLEEVKTSALNAFENQDYPFDRLVEELDVKRDFSRSPLVDVEFSYMSFDTNAMGKDLTMGDLLLKPYHGPLKDSSKADITLFCLETDTLRFTFEYCSAIFQKDRMQRFAGHFHTLMQQVIQDPGIPLGRIDLLSPEEKRLLTEQFNDTAAVFPENKSIHQLFQEQVNRAPHRLAVVENQNGSLTYEQLNRRANRLARHLQEDGIRPGTIVAIQMQASLDMLIAILGILKTGAAYLPVDPAYPDERSRFMMKDSNAVCLLTPAILTNAINRVPTTEPLDTESYPSAATEPAYVIYTSGSTGQPKGVMVEHRALVNLCSWHNREFEVTAAHRASKYAGVGFDASVWEIFPYMVAGAALYIVPEDIKLDMDALNRFFETNGITHAFLPTQVCEEFIKLENKSLLVLLTGGDKLNHFTPPRYRLENNYGPTENTVVSTHFTVDRQYDNIPIGKPVANTRAVILDPNGNLQPVGVPGQLVLTGASLARGYLNRPELTAEKFSQEFSQEFSQDFSLSQKSQDIHSKSISKTCVPTVAEIEKTGYITGYNTGDRARWLPDGNIQFLGRIDHQVKIRGYRIETGEIESKLLRIPGIREAAVIARSEAGASGEKFLCAYVVFQEESKTGDAQLNSLLAEELPEYMLPTRYFRLDSLPLTPNGKVDRKALAARKDNTSTAPAAATGTAPQNDTEKQITEIWKEVLNRDTIGIHENFFDIGGNSLKLIKLTNRLKTVLNRDIPVVTLFRYTTVHSLARYVLKQEGPAHEKVKKETTKNEITRAETAGSINSYREIAVIGMAGRFPGADSIDRYWENLANAVESITFYTDTELQEAGVAPQLIQNPDYVKAGAPLPESHHFDAAFFGYTPREARIMDPQIRIFHETVVEALENAGYHPAHYDGSIGLYAGASSSFHWESRMFQAGQAQELGLFASVNLMDRDFMSTRISYNLNLNGPAFTLQTACSTSLTAIHQASRALMTGECDIALAGGVSSLGIGTHGYLYQEGMVESSDGHCRAFDAAADGTVFGSGSAAVVLKPLINARQDRDTIYAVIKGSAINNDGNRKVGYAAPSIEGQAEVIQKAMKEAGVHPESVSYVETHGTGTALGDPVEVEALKLAFGAVEKNSCGIGSVKTNIGHLDAASGVAGFIKTVLSLYHKQIPPSLHYQKPNPAIDFENSPFYVNAQLQQWHGSGAPLRAGVSSFGIGGTNAHVILEEAPKPRYDAPPAPGTRRRRLIQLSAKTPAALDQLTQNLGRYLKKNIGTPGVTLANTAYTLAVGRGSHRCKRTLICSSLNEAVEALLNPQNTSTKVETHDSGLKNETPPVIFMFPGQGAQYENMARGLYETEPVFRSELDRCFDILEALTPHNIKEILYPGTGGNHNGPDINQTEITQPLIFTIEYALARLLMAWGIEPHAMIGHSIGEYAAAHIAGVMTLEDALKLVVKRGTLMQSLPSGAMLSVPLEEAQLEAFLEAHPEVSAAAFNSTGRSVVSGRHDAVAAFAEALARQGHDTRKLHTSHAFHSPMMDPILDDFTAEVAQIKLHPPTIPYIANTTGQWMTPEYATSPSYYAAHLRGAVRFSDGIAELLNIDNAQLLEVGPGNALSTFARKHADCPKFLSRNIHNLVRHPRETLEDCQYLLQQFARLLQNGVRPDWSAYFAHEPLYRIPLPSYPFQRQFVPPIPNSSPEPVNPKPTRIPELDDWFYIPSWERRPLEYAGGKIRSAGCLRRLSEGQGEAPLGTPFSLRDVCCESVEWVVFFGQNDVDRRIGEVLVKRLKDSGETVITVTPGSAFEEIGSMEFTLNPELDTDYVSLFMELEKIHSTSDDDGEIKILHLWNVTGSENEKKGILDTGIDDTTNHGLHSLLAIARAAGKIGINRNIRIGAITDNLHDVTGIETLQPEKAPLLAAIKIIPTEYPNIHCCGMDIHLPGTPENSILEGIMEEFNDPFTEPVVAFRGHHRWVQTMVPHRLTAPQEPAARLKERGVYLITGGLGGIGLTHAQFLAETVKARLILVSRSPFPPRSQWETLQNTGNQHDPLYIKINKLLDMEKKGAELIIAAADTSDQKQMAAVIEDAKHRFGSINGVLHTAGIADQKGIIQLRNRKDTEEVLAPKVKGTLILNELLESETLDFMVLYSSLATHLHRFQFGQVGYVASNEFLDAYAGYKTRRDGTFTVAVDWTRWSDVGMAVNADTKDKPGEASLDEGTLTPAEGTAALERILAGNQTRVAVSPMNPEHLQQHLERFLSTAGEDNTANEDAIQDGDTAQTPGTGSTRPEMSTDYAPPRSDTEKKLASIWRKYFGIDEIGIEDDFFELGGDSLLAVRLIGDVNKTCSVKLQSHILMQETTIEAVARKVNKIKSNDPESGETNAGKEPGDRQFTSLVPIQTGDESKPALFMVHPIGGHVYFYRELAVSLGASQPVYGLQTRGIDGNGEPIDTIEEMAAHYIAEMQTVQPKGPYYLGGSSFGGMVVYEMERQLRNNSHETALLFMIDTPGPGHMPEKFQDDAEILAYFLNTGHKNSNDSETKATGSTTHGITPEEIRAMSPEERKELVTRQVELPGGTELNHILKVFNANFKAMFEYVPQATPVTILYFRAEKETPQNAKTPEQAWIPLSQGGIDIHDIPGDHITMNHPPNVNKIGTILSERLGKIGNKI